MNFYILLLSCGCMPAGGVRALNLDQKNQELISIFLFFLLFYFRSSFYYQTLVNQRSTQNCWGLSIWWWFIFGILRFGFCEKDSHIDFYHERNWHRKAAQFGKTSIFWTIKFTFKSEKPFAKIRGFAHWLRLKWYTQKMWGHK